MPNITIAKLLEGKEACSACSNHAGIALVGLISCIAAGAMNAAPEFFPPLFYVVLGLSSFPIAVSRISIDKAADRIRTSLAEGNAALDDAVESTEIPFLQRPYAHFALCFYAVFVSGFVVYCGIWLPILDTNDGVTKLVVLIVIGAVSLASLYSLWRQHRHHVTEINPVTLDEEPASIASVNQEPESLSISTYDRLLEMNASYVWRINTVGAAYVAQITCIGAGALISVSSMYQAIVFTIICLGSFYLALLRMSYSFSSQRILKAVDAGNILHTDSPHQQYLLPNTLRAPKLFLLSIGVPPFTVLLGALDSLIGFSILLFVPIILFLLWGGAFLCFISKLFRYPL